MTLTKNLTDSGGMNLWIAREILGVYYNNGKKITPRVLEASNFCAQFGRTSYSFMEDLLGENLAKEVVRIEKLNI